MASPAQTVYFSNTQGVPASKKMRWAGRIISGLVMALLLFDVSIKLMKLAPVVEGPVRLCLLPDLCRGADLDRTFLARRKGAHAHSVAKLAGAGVEDDFAGTHLSSLCFDHQDQGDSAIFTNRECFVKNGFPKRN